MKCSVLDNDKDLRPQPPGIFAHLMIICRLEINKTVWYRKHCWAISGSHILSWWLSPEKGRGLTSIHWIIGVVWKPYFYTKINQENIFFPTDVLSGLQIRKQKEIIACIEVLVKWTIIFKAAQRIHLIESRVGYRRDRKITSCSTLHIFRD